MGISDKLVNEVHIAIEREMNNRDLEGAARQKLVKIRGGLGHELGQDIDSRDSLLAVDAVKDQQGDDDLGFALAHVQLSDYFLGGGGQEGVDVKLGPPTLNAHIHLEAEPLRVCGHLPPGTLQLPLEGDHIRAV